MALWEWVEQWAAANGHDPAARAEGRSQRELLDVHPVARRDLPARGPSARCSSRSSASTPTAVKHVVGQTFATFSGPFLPTGPTNPQVLMSRKSTSAIDVVGSWKMPIDTGTNGDPVTPVPFTAHAFTAPIDRLDGTPDFENLTAYRHEFNDTKYRSVNYQATATTSFMEYFRRGLPGVG